MEQETYDVIVIGAGQGGGPIASAFATSGQTVALIEREFAGGTCVNWGCTPTKTMIASGRVAHLARRGGDYGVETGEITIDMTTVRQRKREVVEMFRQGSRSSIDDTQGLDFVQGDARFTGDKKVEVTLDDGGSRTMQAKTIVLDVGERPRPLDIDNPDSVTLLDSTTVMELDALPEHLLVIGGGYVGLEFAQLFRRLGARVTVVHRGEQLLSREDQDIGEAVADVLRDDGITLMLATTPVRVQRGIAGLDVTVRSGSGEMDSISVSHVLAAAGRIPNTDSLDVGKTGLELDDKGYVQTNERLETAVSGIYAIGDIRPAPKFTHLSYDDYRILQANLIDGGSRSVDDRPTPYTTFIDPQLGRIGLTEREARERGIPYKVGKLKMVSVARAIETAETRGLIKVLVSSETERILGAAVLGIEGGEVAAMIQIAMMGDLRYTALRDGVFAHPNLAEALNKVFGTLVDPSQE
jgi:pyruvate/2-oxoglutarate dehydrogenase complex dihydrolipoamide dehydrogenase (E3) component